VWNWWDGSFPNPADLNNPRGPDAGRGHVIRGGGFLNSAAGTLSAFRLGFYPGNRDFVLGFRLVRP